MSSLSRTISASCLISTGFTTISSASRMIASIALFTSGKPLNSIVNAVGWECRMAEITVKPSPALGMCKSVIRTSKFSVAIYFRASATPLTATTSNPLDLSDSLIMSSTTSSSSTKRTLWIVCVSVEATRHPSRSTTKLTLDTALLSRLVNSDQVAYKLSRPPFLGNHFNHRTVAIGQRMRCRPINHQHGKKPESEGDCRRGRRRSADDTPAGTCDETQGYY